MQISAVSQSDSQQIHVGFNGHEQTRKQNANVCYNSEK